MGLSGHVNQPGCYEDELGIPMSKLLEKYGGIKGKYKSAFHGGISMGVLGTDQYDAPMDFDIGKKYNVLGLGTACVTLMNDTVDMVKVARNCVRFYSHESCGQCTPCREGSAWMHKMLNRILDGRGRPKDLDMLMELGRWPRAACRGQRSAASPTAPTGSSKRFCRSFRMILRNTSRAIWCRACN